MIDLDASRATRRLILRGAAATALAGFTARALTGTAAAKAPMTGTQATAFYRFKLGGFEATVVSDGPLHLGEPRADVFVDTSKEQFTKVLEDNLLPTDNVLFEQNVLAVNTGDRLVLFDTGTGSAKMFGPDSGRLLTNLRGAGIDPKDIDAVVLTHAHPDHCFALLADDGTRNFPNAQIYMAQAELDFWTDEGKLAHQMLGPFVAGARKQLLPNRDRIVFIKDGQEFLPGIQALATPGHTVGHTVYIISSQGKTLCNTGDLANHHVLVVETPRREFAYDTDGKQAVASRVRMFDLLAAGRTPFVAYHFPWPGLGHLVKQGDGFRYLPSPLRMVL
jgi:glyoxylase-like metal-dependent hydrolase (beta-lactamase superfamily II)